MTTNFDTAHLSTDLQAALRTSSSGYIELSGIPVGTDGYVIITEKAWAEICNELVGRVLRATNAWQYGHPVLRNEEEVELEEAIRAWQRHVRSAQKEKK